jgi:hypothetical protein
VTSRASAAAAVLIAIGSSAGLAACGTDPERLDTLKIERGIAAGVERDSAVEVEEVECPERVELEKGDTFQCLVRGEREGQNSIATVTQVDDKGRVRYEVR